MDSRIASISLQSAALGVADLVLPRSCVVCGRTLLLRERHICTECAADLPRTFFAGMRDNPMARAFNALVERDLQLEPVSQPYSYAAALLFYRGDSPYKNIPMRLKYARTFGEGRHFARMLGRDLAASPLFADVDAVIPVPLHWARRWHRGYNQAEVIARGIAEELAGSGGGPAACAVPVMPRVLKRVHRTRTQTLLDAVGRYDNVKSAFVADRKRLQEMPGTPLHLLLVDDVFTTGATLLACERALRRGLAELLGPDTASRVRISVATLAYVG